jgi:type IV secretory pathway ATPase VirB11/archaellum biosynthesis ATPase
MSILDRIAGASGGSPCRCEPTFEDGGLVLEAGNCRGDGRLGEAPACRATVVDALAHRDADAVVVRTRGVERTYSDLATSLLLAAGRFVDRAGFHDGTLAARARRDPLRAARDATARAGVVSDLAAETGLAAVADRVSTGSDDYADVLVASAVPTIARTRLEDRPPDGATIEDVRELDSGAVARVYATESERRYHLRPPELDLDSGALATLSAAHERLADGGDTHPDRAPGRAVRAVADEGHPVATLTQLLEKHTRGYGVLTDFFADGRVSDVYATAPVGETSLRAVVDGTEMPTNVTLTPDGAEAIASRLRRESGRAFSRATPTLDATASLPSGRIRVAAVTDPVSDGTAFAFRDHGRETWTVPALVANDTLTADAGALLSLAVERDAAILIAGPRGAGKTTTLGALLWELPRTTRTLVIEDTPELPVATLQDDGRDVQALRTTTGDGDGPGIPPAEALRTGLRLGDSALVVGEVRGEEAAVLYEAMRVGASDDAVLGTIHGNGGDGVRERVTADLGVPVSSFGATDLVVTLSTVGTTDGDRRRVRTIEEVVPTDEGVRFASLYERSGTDLDATGRVRRGDSHFAASLSRPGEGYDELLSALRDRRSTLAALADRGRTGPAALREAYAGRGGEQ